MSFESPESAPTGRGAPRPVELNDPGACEADDAVTDLAIAVPLVAIPVLAIAVSGLLWAVFGSDRVLVAVVPFGILLAAVTVIDLRELRVPNRLLKPAAFAALPLLAVASTSAWPDVSLVRAVLGAAVYGAVYFVILFIYPPGMGWGDVKLAPLLGAQLGLFGWIPLVRSIVIGHAVGGVVALVIVAVGAVSRGRLRWNIAFPFAPFMAIGAVVALVVEAVA